MKIKKQKKKSKSLLFGKFPNFPNCTTGKRNCKADNHGVKNFVRINVAEFANHIKSDYSANISKNGGIILFTKNLAKI